ncbi:MAG: selenide, water dikinase SelD [Candidatus Zixiibacteriota bacterium]
MAPKVLAEALLSLPQSSHPDLLVGFNKADDAGVFRISDTQALVQTVDFFPPIVDDPYYFGQIAAANALSDIFAMGGKPLTALNIVGFPVSKMPISILTEILRGGSEKIEEAGAVIVGGHSIKDNELKYGVAATGIIDIANVITNAGAKAGDILFLTKSLGTGLITTGIKRNAVSAELTEIVTKSMAALNRTAAELMHKHHAHAGTDITGYGLLGHAYEVASASNVSIRIFSGALPLLPEVKTLAAAGMIPGGANDNRAYLESHVAMASAIDKNLEHVLYDPQTSGGLFIAVAPEHAPGLSRDLKSAGLPYAHVGVVESLQKYHLIIE